MDDVANKKQDKLGYFMQIWLKLNGVVLWILINLFIGSKKVKEVNITSSLSSSSEFLANCALKDDHKPNKVPSKKAVERRKEIVNQFDGNFEKKFLFFLRRLKQAKMLSF